MSDYYGYKYDSKEVYGNYDNRELSLDQLYELIMAMELSAEDIKDGAITSPKVADLAIGYAHINEGSIGEVHIREASINHAAIQMAAVRRANIQDAAIGTAQIEDLAVDGAKIGFAAITRTKIAEAAIGEAQIDDLAVTRSKIANAAIGNAQIEDASISMAKISDLEVDTAFIKDLSVTTAKIDNLAITTGKIDDLAVSNAKIRDAAITSAKIELAQILTAHIADAQINSAKIIDGEITNAKIANAAITNAKIGDAEISTAKIAVGAITSGLIETGAIGTAQIADASITDAKIVELTANKITAGILDVERLRITGPDSILYEINVNNVGELAASEVTLDGESITERSITADRIVAGAITAAEIAAESITANHMVANTITAASGVIADLAITNAMIASLDGGKITANTIDANRLKAGTVIADDITFTGHLQGATGTFSGTISTARDAMVGNNLYLGKIEDVYSKEIVFNADSVIEGTGKVLGIRTGSMDISLDYTSSFVITAGVETPFAINDRKVSTAELTALELKVIKHTVAGNSLTLSYDDPENKRVRMEYLTNGSTVFSTYSTTDTWMERMIFRGRGANPVVFPAGIESDVISMLGTGAANGLFFPGDHSISSTTTGHFYAYGNRATGDPFIVRSHSNRSAYRNDFEVRNTGYVWMPTTAENESTSAANMRMGTTGQILRVTSSAKSKILAEPVTVDPYKILEVKAKDWYDKNNYEKYADLLTREANGEDVAFDEIEDLKRVIGFIAEDFHNVGLTQLVDYGESDEIIGLQYDRIPVIHHELLRDIVYRLVRLEKINGIIN